MSAWRKRGKLKLRRMEKFSNLITRSGQRSRLSRIILAKYSLYAVSTPWVKIGSLRTKKSYLHYKLFRGSETGGNYLKETT